MGHTIGYDPVSDSRVVSYPHKTGKQHKKVQKPWWYSECDEAVANRKKAFKKLIQGPSSLTLNNYRKISQTTRKTLLKRKRANFRSFVNDINDNFTISSFWDSVNKLRSCPFNNFPNYSNLTSKKEAITNTINKLAPCWVNRSFEITYDK